jgi:exodeoxyribonuclease-3
MNNLRLATWNINSVRLRIDLVARLTAEAQPDILCLQETKAADPVFPFDALRAMGWRHIHAAGMKGYNGVAILSRRPFAGTEVRDWCGKSDARHAIVTLRGGIEIHNFYVPAGGDVPDPEQNEKFAHKLRFLDEVTAWFRARKRPDNRFILVGDLNIAPLEADVWSHKQLLSVVSHTPVEVERLARLQASNDWIDAVRKFSSPDEKLYSWWSYRARDWAAADKGRRLDHVWLTPGLAPRLKSAQILRNARGWERPSDHAPVIVTLR